MNETTNTIGTWSVATGREGCEHDYRAEQTGRDYGSWVCSNCGHWVVGQTLDDALASAAEVLDDDPVDEVPESTLTFDIDFPLVERAEAFVERMNSDRQGWWVVELEHKPGRRHVRIVKANRSRQDLSDRELGLEVLDTVGYYGSDTTGSRKALVTCPELGWTAKRAPGVW